jgi:hypothetical protein
LFAIVKHFLNNKNFKKPFHSESWGQLGFFTFSQSFAGISGVF